MIDTDRVLLDGLRQAGHISFHDFSARLAKAAARHGGQMPTHVLASASQVDAWAAEFDPLMLRRPSAGDRVVKLMGVTVLTVAGPLRLIWSETIEGADKP